MAQSKSQHARREHQFAMVKAERNELQARIDRALELLDDYNIADWYPCTETDAALRLERAIRAALKGDGDE